MPTGRDNIAPPPPPPPPKIHGTMVFSGHNTVHIRRQCVAHDAGGQ